MVAASTVIAGVKYAAAWLAILPLVMQAGIQEFDLLLPPTEAFVHYNDGYIRAPGYIDLKGLTFTAISEGFVNMDDTYDDNEEEDDKTFNDQDDKTDGSDASTIPPDGGASNSTEPPRQRRNRKQRRLDGGVEKDGTDVDIAVFRLPRSCVHSRNGCDWADLGVGNRSDDGALRWCCSQEAIDLGMCDEDESGYGRLIIDKNKYKGEHRFVTVPPEGPMSKSIRYGHLEQSESGTYVVLYANCNERGREIYVEGQSIWKSVHGYLPGELYGFMYFYIVLTVIYFVLLVWYGICMFVNEESRIEIEKWIFFAICLGLLEMIFRTGDYFVWNTDGVRNQAIIWIGVLTGVLKQGISRCLIVMVSLGWGVVRDSLGSTMRIIVVLGAVYIGTTAVRDLMLVFAIEDMNILSYNAEKDIFSVVKILTLIISFIDVVFILWILDALNNTMMYLENMNQSRKLERFLKLRCLFLFSIMFATMWAVFTLVDAVNEEGIVQEEHAWAIDAATEVNYLFVLIGVAYLWRPNPSAREYAYVMELPAMGMDGEHELELTGAVPSAMDDDDDDDDAPNGNGAKNGFSDNGFHDDPDHKNDSRFQIT